MELRKRLVKRFRKIADDYGITYAEVLKIYKSQFKFTKQKIEELTSEEIENMDDDELEKYTFNYIYIGKVFTNNKLKEHGKSKKTRSTNNQFRTPKRHNNHNSVRKEGEK